MASGRDLRNVQENGTTLTANDNFLEVMGYRPEEIEEEHHRILAPLS